MARPRKEGLDYFPHDTDASGDEKIEAMRALFGNDGYAFYMILCERIYRTSNAELDISKHVLIAPIIKKLLVDQERFNEMLDAAFELNLFSRADYELRGVLTSSGIKKRFREVSQMRERWRKQKQNPAQTEEFHVENGTENCMENAEETRESKAKQSKVNEIEINKTSSSRNSGENPFTIFTNHSFGKLDDLTREFIFAAIDDYSELWVVQAMKEAIALNKPIWRYVERTLQRWKTLNHPEPWTVDKPPETKPSGNVHNFPIQRGKGSGKPQIPIAQPNTGTAVSPERLEQIMQKAQKLDAMFNGKEVLHATADRH
jgi:DnaD/phage-associated family protein